MKLGDKAYSEAVDRKLAEIRGNVSSVKMTPQECEEEIKAVTGGAFEQFNCSNNVPEGTPIIVNSPQILPRKRGRPPGSKNKPKT